MYQVGDLIIYEQTGVCRIDEIGAPAVPYLDKGKTYYTMAPMYSTETIYVPVDTKAFMRPIMARAEAEELIRRIPAIGEETIEIKNLQMLSIHYQASFQTHDCNDLVRLIKTVYLKNENAQKSGKKPGKIDERYLKRAEDLLYGELAAALGIPRECVPDYIKRTLASLEAGPAA